MKSESIEMKFDVDIDSFISNLVYNVSIDDIFEIITTIDLACAEWELSERLYEHYKSLHEQYLSECEE